MTTFRRMRKEEFRKLARRTDVCNYCLAGQSIRKKLGKLLKSAKGKSGYSMSVWNVSRSSGLILQCMLNSPGSVPQNIKLQAAEYIQQLVEIDLHTEEFRRQNAIYAEKTQDPGDSLVITLDYKEKGRFRRKATAISTSRGNTVAWGFAFFPKQTVTVQNLSLSGITSILTYRKTSDGKIFIATFSDEKKHFEIDRSTTSTNFEHVPKVSNKLPLTPNEKAIIGDDAEKKELKMEEKIKEWQEVLRELELDEEDAAEGRKKRLLVKKIRDLKENIAKAEARLLILTQGSTVSAQLEGLHLSSSGSRKRPAEGELPNNDVKMSASPGRDRDVCKVDFLIPNGASMIGLRKSMFELAHEYTAHEPLNISYHTEENAAIKAGTSLRVMVHFPSYDLAAKMLATARKLLERQYRSAPPPLDFEVRRSTENLGPQVFADRYRLQPSSPNRTIWNDVIEPAPSDTTAEGTSRLTVEEIKTQTPMDPKMFGEGGAKAEWAHIKEWSKDNCTHQEGADPSNRLILDPIHHQMYDARRRRNVCGVTFFMDESDCNTREQTTLHVLYANADAACLSRSLHNATFKSTNHYTVQIQHPEPQELHRYLNARHNRNIRENENFKRYLPN